jgi:DNA polymerase III delta prime subunit
VKEHIKRICTEESMKYTEEGVDKVLEQHYPSIRNCVICLQDLHTEGKDVTPENVTYADDIYEVLWENIKNKKWQDVKEAIMASDVDPRDVNNYFWRKSLDEQNLRLIQLTCRNEKDIAQGSDPKVVFVTSIIEMCK